MGENGERGETILSGCRIFECARGGTHASGGHLAVNGCFIYSNGLGDEGWGIRLDGSSNNNAIVGNVINWNSGWGIISAGAGSNVITGNVVRGNVKGPLSVSSTNTLDSSNLTS